MNHGSKVYLSKSVFPQRAGENISARLLHRPGSNEYPLNLVEPSLLGAAVVKLPSAVKDDMHHNPG